MIMLAILSKGFCFKQNNLNMATADLPSSSLNDSVLLKDYNKATSVVRRFRLIK